MQLLRILSYAEQMRQFSLHRSKPPVFFLFRDLTDFLTHIIAALVDTPPVDINAVDVVVVVTDVVVVAVIPVAEF